MCSEARQGQMMSILQTGTSFFFEKTKNYFIDITLIAGYKNIGVKVKNLMCAVIIILDTHNK